MTSDREILRARAQRLAAPLVDRAPSGLRPAIVVTIDSQQFAFPLADVRRASVMGPLTEVPHVPPIVLGLGALEGSVLAVFDGRVWAGGARRPRAERTPVLILGPADAPLALAVDGFIGSVSLSTKPAVVGTGWLEELTDGGILVVRVDALLQDPVFSPAPAS